MQQPHAQAQTQALPSRRSLLWAHIAMSYSALGTIYGDIGTSPLYTVTSILAGKDSFDQDDILMVISLIFWSLTLVCLFKYVVVVLHANDNGEGGKFALYTRLCRVLGVSPLARTMEEGAHTALLNLANRPDSIARRSKLSTYSFAQTSTSDESGTQVQSRILPSSSSRWWNRGALPAAPIRAWFRRSVVAQRVLLVVSVVTTGMILADGVLTPVVSVVGAMSGLKVAVAGLSNDVVVGASVGLLVLLFSFQFVGTHRVSAAFSPVVLLWLVINAAIGVYNITRAGGHVFESLSPHWIARYFLRHGRSGWESLGAVMLSVTGAEAMFADLGHFSIPSVSISWGVVAYPCLVLTYLGQGAHLLLEAEAAADAYWSSVPKPLFYPMLVLATLASLVASQALIAAVFSISKQAKVLGLLPSMRIVHTSADHMGQIYVPFFNWLLMLLTVAVVVGFDADSVKLGYAYGLTISAAMLVTTLLVSLIMVLDWNLSLPLVLGFLVCFGILDGAFLSANAIKVPHGGWLSLAMAFTVSAVMLVWWVGQSRTTRVISRHILQPQQLFRAVPRIPPSNASPKSSTVASWRDGKLGKAAADAGVTQQQQQQQQQPGGGTKTTLAKELVRVVAEAADDRDDGGVSVSPSRAHQGNNTQPRVPELELQILRGQMGLELSVGVNKPLTELPGVAVYYTESPDGVPQVLQHFLRNVPAIHQVNIFLRVVHLPLPNVPKDSQLVLACVPGVPNTYHAEAKYGYMDVVRQDDAFMVQLVEAAAAHIMQLAGIACDVGHDADAADLAHATVPEDEEAGGGVDANTGRRVAAGTQSTSTNLRAQSAPALDVENATAPKDTTPGQQSMANAFSGSGRASTRLKQPNLDTANSLDVPFEPPRMRLDLSRLTRSLQRSSSHMLAARSAGGSLGPFCALPAAACPEIAAASQPLPGLGALTGGGRTHSQVRSPPLAPALLPGVDAGLSGFDGLMHVAKELQSAGIAYDELVAARAYTPGVQRAALRVAALMAAAAEGVTHYMGRVSLRTRPAASFVHQLLFGQLYRPLLLLAYDDSEQWEVPVNNLVEVGMVAHV